MRTIVLSNLGQDIEQNFPQKLLQRPHPEPGESLTGYLMRLAKNNFTHASILTRGLRSRKSMERSYAWDLFGPEDLDFDRLSVLTDVSVVKLQALTFYPLWGRFGLQPLSSRATAAFVSTSVVKTHRRFCPMCLKENGIWILLWNIYELTICPFHRVLFQESCFECGSKQPYLSVALEDFQCVNGCRNLLNDSPETVVHERRLHEEKEKWTQWNTMLNSSGQLISSIEGYSSQQNIVATVFYLRDLNAKSHEPLSNKRKLKNSLQSDNVGRTAVPPLQKLLQVLRGSNIPLSELPKYRVPKSFLDSFHQDPRTAFVCMVPWCPCYGRREKMLRGTSKGKVYHGVKYTYYSMCTECGIEHGIDSCDSVWKIIKNDTIFWIMKIREMLLNGATRYQIYTTVKLSRNNVCNCIGYLAYHKLLPEELLGKYTPQHPIRHGLVEKFKKLAIDAAKRRLTVNNWYTASDEFDFTEYFYYLADKEVRLYFFSEYKFPARSNNPSPKFHNRKISEKFGEDIEKAIKGLINREIKISLNSVARELGVTAAVITNHGYGELVDKWKNIQRKHYKEKLLVSAYRFREMKHEEGRPFRPADFFIEQGINPRSARKKHPEMFDILEGDFHPETLIAWAEAAVSTSREGDENGT